MATRKQFIKFADICINVYVRTQVSEERVRWFADLYTSSAAGTIPPIQVNGNNVLIDGRTRMLALKYLGETGCVCEIHEEVKDNFDITIAAMKANVGGAKELTGADIRQTIIRLLENGESRRRIVAELPFPKEVSKKLVKAADVIWTNQKCQRALNQYRSKEYASLADAAEANGVAASTVETFTAKAERREREEGELSNTGSFKGTITSRYYGMTNRMGNYFKKLAVRYEVGDFSEAQVREIVAHVQHQARIHAAAMQDWSDRFDVMIKTRRPIVESPMPPKKFQVNEKTLAN
jgi:hypothetical protein